MKTVLVDVCLIMASLLGIAAPHFLTWVKIAKISETRTGQELYSVQQIATATKFVNKLGGPNSVRKKGAMVLLLAIALYAFAIYLLAS